MLPADRFRTERLDPKRHDRTAFSCGEPSLDRYLREQARQDMANRLAIAYVLTESTNRSTIVGYYTLSTYGIDAGEIPPDLARKVGRYRELPAVLIGRLAVSSAAQGRGIGATLVLDALARSLALGEEAGCLFVVVDAIDDRAIAFYERHGFRRFPRQADKLLLPVQSVADLFAR